MPPHTHPVTRELRTISAALNALAENFRRLVPALAGEMSSRSQPTVSRDARTRRKPRFTPAFRRHLKLQGRYMGTMRRLKPRQRAQVKKIRTTKGVRAAIAAARRMAQ
jgi:hypothetical protein